jgi:hypothetical protein
MRRNWIALVAGLALLAQGTAMATVSIHVAVADPAPAAQEAMPCHGDAPPDAAGTSSMPCDCCDGGCIFACGGAPLPAMALGESPAAPDHVFPAAPVPALLASHTLSPFRPPAR